MKCLNFRLMWYISGATSPVHNSVFFFYNARQQCKSDIWFKAHSVRQCQEINWEEKSMILITWRLYNNRWVTLWFAGLYRMHSDQKTFLWHYNTVIFLQKTLCTFTNASINHANSFLRHIFATRQGWAKQNKNTHGHSLPPQSRKCSSSLRKIQILN